MAHRIVGIDVGYRSVKAAVIDKSMRQTALVSVDREDIGVPGDAKAIQVALGKLLGRNKTGGDDIVVSGLPMGPCLHRVLKFPFSDEKALAESVGFELEGHIPVDAEDLLIDYIVVDQVGDETEVLTIAAPRSVVAEHLNVLRAAGAEPRSLGVSPLAYATLLAQLPSLADRRALVLDVGARETEAVIVSDGRVRFARSLSVGSDAVRESFANKFASEGVDGDLLITHCLLLPPGMPPSQPAEQILHSATVDALMPWLRELRQSLAAAMRGGKPRPDCLVLTGGMAGLRGLVEYLEHVMQMPVKTIDLTELAISQLQTTDKLADQCSLAVALALQATELKTQDALDFRKGDLAYEGDFKYLQRRVPQIAAFFVIALCLLGVRTTIQYRGLVQEYERQRSHVVKISHALTGKKLRSFPKLKTEMNRGLPVDLASYYPDISAIRAFEELSGIIRKVTEPPDFKGEIPTPGVKPPGPGGLRPPPRLGGRVGIAPGMGATLPSAGAVPFGDESRKPPGEGGGQGDGGEGGEGGEGGAKAEGFFGHKIELLSVDLDRAKGSLRGDCDSQDALLALQEAINRHRCFGKVKSSSDRITFQRHKDWFRFNMRFEIGCPDDADAGKAKASGKDGKGGDGKKGGAGEKGAAQGDKSS